jgi:hypothetical protein
MALVVAGGDLLGELRIVEGGGLGRERRLDALLRQLLVEIVEPAPQTPMVLMSPIAIPFR